MSATEPPRCQAQAAPPDRTTRSAWPAPIPPAIPRTPAVAIRRPV